MRFAGTGSALLVAAGLSLAGCAHTEKPAATIPMSASNAAPTAKGEVAITPSGPNNRLVLSVEGLAPPSVVDPASRLYVAWIEPLDGSGEPQNLGAFTVDEDGEGRLMATTPMRRFQVFVTPEPASTVRTPSGRQLLTADVAPRAPNYGEEE